ncbi:hypothetical protein [Paenibacillus sp. YPG26]|uniref:hypothetical protein n=1 Tax=Paenibacillus sp. YPG26 TaxID=2878915 RepID=UPI0020417385|nr:hypothetical protein [Paenibacillus sp. YPG26]USB32726.1 hypothetical protein LDO05_15945 [Paenibacillus sp. YPG26]
MASMDSLVVPSRDPLGLVVHSYKLNGGGGGLLAQEGLRSATSRLPSLRDPLHFFEIASRPAPRDAAANKAALTGR